MVKLEQMITNVVAIPIAKPLIADVVVPNVGHIPNNKTNIGFSLIMPFNNIFRLLMIIAEIPNL